MARDDLEIEERQRLLQQKKEEDYQARLAAARERGREKAKAYVDSVCNRRKEEERAQAVFSEIGEDAESAEDADDEDLEDAQNTTILSGICDTVTNWTAMLRERARYYRINVGFN